MATGSRSADPSRSAWRSRGPAHPHRYRRQADRHACRPGNSAARPASQQTMVRLAAHRGAYASHRLPVIARYFLERRTIGSADGRDRTSAFEPAETPANCGLFRHVSRHCGRVRDRSHGYCCRPDAAARSRLRRHREPESDAGGRLSSPAEERCRLEAENLFLRHQLSIALRHAPLRPRLRGSDRALLVWMTQLWREPACPDRGTSS
jgi:hypothetical protein